MNRTNDIFLKIILLGIIIYFGFSALTYVSFVLGLILIAGILVVLLDPAVSFLEKYKVPRFLSSGILIFSCTFIFIKFVFLFVPFLFQKINLVIRTLNTINLDSFTISLEKILKDLGFVSMFSKQEIYFYIKEKINLLNILQETLLKSITHLGNLLIMTVVTPFLTFLCLKDLKSLKRIFKKIIPYYKKREFENITRDLHELIFKYWSGQLIVSIFLFVFYSITLYIFNIKNGIIIGFIFAVANFFPYLGFYLATFLTLLLNIDQSSLAHDLNFFLFYFVKLMAIILLGQVIEGNFITPKIVGSKVGVHPVFIILGTMLSVPIFGLFGLILGTPLTIIISYFLRLFLDKRSRNHSF